MSDYLTVTIGGVDRTAYVKSCERHTSICEIECTATLDVLPQAPLFDPYQEVKIYVSGSLHFTGYAEKDSLERRTGQWTRQVRCQHRGYKRLRDYWFTNRVSTNIEEPVSEFLARVCGAAGVHIEFTSVEDNPLPDSYSWEFPSAMQVFEDCLTFGELQPIALPNGDIEVTQLAISNTTYFDSEDLVTQCERTTDDTFFRTDVAFITAREVIMASGSNPFGYHRTAIVANPMVHDFGTGYFLGQDILAEYNRMQKSQNVTIVGNHHFSPGETLRTRDKFDQDTELGIITSIDEFQKVDGGRYMEVVTNQRCPRIFGFDYSLFDVYAHKPIAVGLDVSGSGRVYVTPDITQAWLGATGSGFQYGNDCEWYDCSVGLSGIFDGVIRYGTYAPWPGTLIRDVYADEGRGAWALTDNGLYHSDAILPPSGQATGSWPYTAWMKVLDNPEAGGYYLVYAREKGEDSTGIWVVEAQDSGAGKLKNLYIYKVSQTGSKTLMVTLPTAAKAVHQYGYTLHYHASPVINVSREGQHDFVVYGCKYQCFGSDCGGYDGLPAAGTHWHGLLYDVDGATEYDHSDHNIYTHGNYQPRYTEVTSEGKVITFVEVTSDSSGETSGSIRAYEEYGTSSVILDDLPGGWTMAGGWYNMASQDAKHERWYCLGRAKTSPPQYVQSVFRSDDNCATWAQKSTVTSGSIGRGFLTSKILAYVLYPYVQTYCITAIPSRDPSGTYDTVYVSPDDGTSFYSSGCVPGIIKTIMPMDE